MKFGRQDILRYTLSTIAFVGALAVASGCETAHPAPPVALVEPAAPVAAPVVSTPVAVNAYGEFGGAATSATGSARSSTAFQQHTFAVEGRDSEVTVDPTGKILAYSSTRNSEHPDIYLQKVNGVSVVQLTDDPADDAFPAFSPDGRTLAFSSTRNGNWDVYTMDTDGRHVVQVTNSPSQDLHPSFSPDGTRLAYCAMGSRSDNWEMWVVNLQTGEKRMIGYGLFPTWSPDKAVDRIAFQRAGQRGGRLFSLWTLDLIDGEGRHVTEVASAADAAIVSPAWSPDGQKLAYASIHPAMPGAAERKEIWSVNADGTDRQRLTDGLASNLSPAWAVDNRVYFVSDRGGSESIWSVRADAAIAPVATAKPPVAKEEPVATANAPVAPAPAEHPVAEAKHADGTEKAPEAPAAEKPVASVEGHDKHEQAPTGAITAVDTHEVAH